MKFPYASYLTAQIPAAREQAKETILNDIRMSELAQTASQFNENQAMQKEINAKQAEQAKSAQNIQLASLAGQGLYLTKDAWMPAVKETVIPAVKTAAGNISSSLTGIASKKVAETAAEAVSSASQTAAAADAGSLAGQQAAEQISGSLAAEQAAATEAAREAAGIGAGMSGAAGQSGYAAGETAAGAGIGYAWPLAVVAAVDMLRKSSGGDLESPYSTKTDQQKVYAAPGTAPLLPLNVIARQVTGDANNPLSRSIDWLGNQEEKFVGKPLDKAFSGDIVGSLESFGKATVDLFTGKACIIITCCTHPDSDEVNLARAYRDQFLTPTELRGYYMIAEETVPKLLDDEKYKHHVKKTLVDPLIEYGSFALGKTTECSQQARTVAEDFIARCRIVGASVAAFKRSNGEVV
jgi:hypothetical protein